MNKGMLIRGGVILGLAALSVYAAYPPKEKLNLGLDLQGGIYLVLKVETQDAVRAETDKDMEILRREIADGGVSSVATSRTSDTSFDVTGVAIEQEAVLNKAANDYLTSQRWDWRRDGSRTAFTMTSINERNVRNLAVEQAKLTIDNRVNQYGVAEPNIARQGSEGDRIVVQLPGVDDPERVKRLIKSTAFLEFRLTEYPPAGGSGLATREEILSRYGGALPADVEIIAQDKRDDQGRVLGSSFFAVQSRRVITGRDLKSANMSTGQFNQPVVAFHLTADGARMFGDATGANVGRGLAIILDNRIVSAPVINSRITDSGVIEGNFTQQEVQDLVTTLRSGALPAGITYLEDRTVGPSLGQDSIDASTKAGLYSLIGVVLTMLIVYRFSGVNAILALALNTLLLFGALAYFGATLTLPGIAGIVLSIAMAVDANVLIFERIKEEMKVGKTVRAAIDGGFKNALSSIMDANITTLIAALFLFQFGTGPIRGFAVTLSVGILGTLFCAIFVSRYLFDLVYTPARKSQSISI
ncbi:MAG: protein translocase subunit SecD [Thermoanaerobaculia bacterium]